MQTIKEKTLQSQEEGFWDHPKEAEKLLKTISTDKVWTDRFATLQSQFEDLEVLYDFYESKEATEEELQEQYDLTLKLLEDLEFMRMLSGEEDEMSAILQINPGAGGTESNDWAEMLLRMYMRWAENHGYKVTQLDYQEGDVAGIKSASIQIDGSFAFGYLKGENGVHRLVRLSPFNAAHKRQTSFASVYVYPLLDEDIEVEINPADISWDTFRSSGPGGQGVNKIESAVRLRHEPSGIIIECQVTRSQLQNRNKALQLLKSQLYELELRKKQEEKAKIEGSKKKIEWGSQIRNYILHPYKLVKDVRTGYETGNANAVLDGDLDGFIKAYLMEFGG